MFELQREKKRLDREIVSVAEPVNIVTLHPGAVDRYLSKVNDLSAALRSGSTLANNELTAPVRALIEVAIVQPTPAGVAPDVEARGRIAALLGLDVYPQGRTSGKMVAEVRYRRSPRQDLPLFTLQLASA
jgi:hypothetical protein